MAEESYMTKVKVISNFHEFTGLDKNNEVEIPTHLVRTYASLGTVELPEAMRKEDEAAAKKQAAKEAK